MNEELYNPYYNPSWGTPKVKGFGASEFPSWGTDNIKGYGDSGPNYGQHTQPANYGQMLGNAASSAMAGFSAGQAGGTPRGNFQMDDGAILGSAASGFATGGPIGALIGGTTAFFKQDKALKENTENVNTSFNGMTDAYGRPVYNSGEFAQGFSDFSGLIEATRPGAHALRPRRRKQMMKKAEELYRGIGQGQQNYNQAEGRFRQQNIAQQEYLERMNRNYTY